MSYEMHYITHPRGDAAKTLWRGRNKIYRKSISPAEFDAAKGWGGESLLGGTLLHFPLSLTPDFDADDQPSEPFLNYVRTFSPSYVQDKTAFAMSVGRAWHWQELSRLEHPLWHLSTGGWSGNEAIVAALLENHFWKKRLVESKPGGHYVFSIATLKAKLLAKQGIVVVACGKDAGEEKARKAAAAMLRKKGIKARLSPVFDDDLFTVAVENGGRWAFKIEK